MGCETDTYDSEGARVRLAPWRHVKREDVETLLDRFRGEIEQTPPMCVQLFHPQRGSLVSFPPSFSALKMDGMPLYEYARKGIPLPRPIEKRKVTVHSLELIDWKGSDHTFRWPDKQMSEEEKKAMEAALETAGTETPIKDEPDASAQEEIPAAFVLTMKVSGGTYVRSIVHDLSHALGSAGHVVTLSRRRQGRFTLEPTEERDKGCVPWDVFRKAYEFPGEIDEDGWAEWEREVMNHLDIVEDGKQ